MQKSLTYRKVGIQHLKGVMVLFMLACFSITVNAQFIVSGAAVKIVSTGTPQIVLNDISYKNEASSAALSGAGLTLSFTGSGASATTISSVAGYTTNPANVIMNRASGVTLQAPMAISSALNLSNGKLDLTTFDLDMASSTINGGSPTSYVKTSSSGKLKRNAGIAAGTVVFPVGKSSYNPATINNTGADDKFGVRVYDYVATNGIEGGAQTSGDVVNRTWVVSEDLNGGSIVDLRMQWNAGEEHQNFTYNPGFMNVVQFNGTTWQETGANYQNNTPFTVGQGNFSQLTSFTLSMTGSVLPIELVSFQANCAGEDKINVTWTTASEHNTSHYVVEHSRNGNDWEALTIVAAAGNSTSLLDYTYVHENPNAGTNYYRLTQYDNDGEFEQFNAVAVDCDNMNSNTTLSTYPNPSDNSFYISLYTEEMDGAGVITITDTKGAVVYTQDVNIQKGNSVFYMNNMQVAPGMYYIQVTNGNKSTYIVKHSLR